MSHRREERMVSRGTHMAVGLVLCLLAMRLAACGDDGPSAQPETVTRPPPPQQRLPEARQREVFAGQQEISAYCRRRALSLQSDEAPPSSADARRALAAADRLAELARARPYDLVQTGVDMRLYVGDLVEDLGNLSCDPALVERLAEGLG
jgi:predicted small lipoprotein YifL